MRRFWLILGIVVTGCVANNGLFYDSVSESNQYHLARVRKGMSEKQVLQIMHKPFSYETFQVEDNIYDVWFYVTRPTGLDQTRMVPQNLTPLTFKNGVLVGTGYHWYYYAMKEQAGEIAIQKPKEEKPKTQKEEDVEFEKTLQGKQRQPEQVPAKEQPTAQPPTKPIENKAIDKEKEKEKLPPNVHIIGQSDADFDSDPTCKMIPAPTCKPTPTKVYGSERFALIKQGMTEIQVIQALGEPIKHETFQISSDVYDAWFYDTMASRTGKPSIVPQNQTILTFKNARLISREDEKYFELIKRSSVRPAVSVIQPQPSVVKPQQQPENNGRDETPATVVPESKQPDAGSEQQTEELEQKTEEPEQQTEELEQQSEEQGSVEESVPGDVESTPSDNESKQQEETMLAPDMVVPESKLSAAELAKRQTNAINNDEIRSKTVTEKQMSSIQAGMRESEVQKLLGSTDDHEDFMVGEDEIHVWFYQVEQKKVPLTFKNEILVGKTNEEYRSLKTNHSDRIDKKVDRMEEDESEQNFDYW